MNVNIPSYSLSSPTVDVPMPLNNKFEINNKRALTINTNNGQYNNEYDGLFPQVNLNPMTMAAAALAMFGATGTQSINATNSSNVILNTNGINNNSYVNPFFYQTFLRFPLHQKPLSAATTNTAAAAVVTSPSSSSTSAPNSFNFFSI